MRAFCIYTVHVCGDNLRQNAFTVKLEFDAPEETGDSVFVLNVICDSYMGCDQEYEIPLRVIS